MQSASWKTSTSRNDDETGVHLPVHVFPRKKKRLHVQEEDQLLGDYKYTREENTGVSASTATTASNVLRNAIETPSRVSSVAGPDPVDDDCDDDGLVVVSGGDTGLST